MNFKHNILAYQGKPKNGKKKKKKKEKPRWDVGMVIVLP
jgi:hypothetical protein